MIRRLFITLTYLHTLFSGHIVCFSLVIKLNIILVPIQSHNLITNMNSSKKKKKWTQKQRKTKRKKLIKVAFSLLFLWLTFEFTRLNTLCVSLCRFHACFCHLFHYQEQVQKMHFFSSFSYDFLLISNNFHVFIFHFFVFCFAMTWLLYSYIVYSQVPHNIFPMSFSIFIQSLLCCALNRCYTFAWSIIEVCWYVGSIPITT